ncbi:helix-turn-helix domain-containing protein [Aquimarina sp. 2201CG5-10]|uniref:helix-turn-helix domain-containing protein n=1 Tax=Aquimarina callyspongiae TaxID=3098150 RepID=UPI002AB3DA9B|nr:helix-turn-helix domain-containing protein [Aquimarina sp. 2201CG5-10]MDY8134451.1 helix-turn-helix domain-containing protein [Aquimarina sp. 2201CG5-10]
MSNVFAIISGIGAIQSILFALLIVLKKKRKLPDWILIFWFLVFAIHLLIGINKRLHPSDAMEILIMTIGLLHAPFFLLYTKSIFNQELRKIDQLHFLPFLIFLIISFFIPKTSELQWEITTLFAKLISLTFYPLYILYAYNKKLDFLKNNKADSSILELSWIRIIAFLFLISTGISIIRLTTELMVGVRYFEIWDVLRYVILVTVIGFYGLKYGMVYRPEVPSESIIEEKKYKHSPLKNKEMTVYRNMIDHFFQENDAYLHPDFSLAVLSTSVDIPKHHLSQIINSEMNTTFYDLVNTKRVTYATNRIKEGKNQNLTLEGLGYESGFNSKSAFFHHFKKITGKTPGQFKKEISTD